MWTWKYFNIDEVFNLDRLKQRLDKNMEDRKVEVDTRQEIQRREMKMIAEELHDLKLKRQNLILKIDKVFVFIYLKYNYIYMLDNPFECIN